MIASPSDRPAVRAARKNLRRAVLFVAISVFLPLMATWASAQTLTVLHSFSAKADGAFPYGGLVMDPAGNLYGTTSTGGRYKDGTIYKIDTSGKMTVLHQFTRKEACSSFAPLLIDKHGNLYGTAFSCGIPIAEGIGTVFELKATGRLVVLHAFGSVSGDGALPYAGLVRDAAGSLYGTTSVGGDIPYGAGTVFKIDRNTGAETVLHNFANIPDGAFPSCRLLIDSAGNLYGTTEIGGALGGGSVFKLDSSGDETILYSFGTSSNTDGTSPVSGVIRDSDGNFYGTTAAGGSYDYGTIYKIDANGNEVLLHSFDGTNGGNPYAGLVRDLSGNLYGTTYLGSSYNAGVLFKLDPAGAFTILHTFTGPEGSGAYDGAILDKSGNLYGTTVYGGDYGYGVVYKLTP
jgi:uncharacterized repeat protein (TIGR03803 family)